MRGSWAHGYLCHTLYCQVHGCHCSDGDRRAESWAPLSLDRQIAGPAAAAALFLVATGDAAAGRLELCVPLCLSPAVTGFSRAVGSAITARGPPSQVPSLLSPLVPPPLCVPVHPLLDVQMWGILQNTCVLGRDTFVGCRLMGREKKVSHASMMLTPLSL